ncbi:hypothetical protein BJ741DRAFT_616627 [Chytriomyces cf. hyalinus JEL632]|nr:hypothetical protein BJ741DRAFT_616627 [Chytriomyces cf. hyalinus JEL632]
MMGDSVEERVMILTRQLGRRQTQLFRRDNVIEIDDDDDGDGEDRSGPPASYQSSAASHMSNPATTQQLDATTLAAMTPYRALESLNEVMAVPFAAFIRIATSQMQPLRCLPKWSCFVAMKRVHYPTSNSDILHPVLKHSNTSYPSREVLPDTDAGHLDGYELVVSIAHLLFALPHKAATICKDPLHMQMYINRPIILTQLEERVLRPVIRPISQDYYATLLSSDSTVLGYRGIGAITPLNLALILNALDAAVELVKMGALCDASILPSLAFHIAHYEWSDHLDFVISKFQTAANKKPQLWASADELEKDSFFGLLARVPFELENMDIASKLYPVLDMFRAGYPQLAFHRNKNRMLPLVFILLNRNKLLFDWYRKLHVDADSMHIPKHILAKCCHSSNSASYAHVFRDWKWTNGKPIVDCSHLANWYWYDEPKSNSKTLWKNSDRVKKYLPSTESVLVLLETPPTEKLVAASKIDLFIYGCSLLHLSLHDVEVVRFLIRSCKLDLSKTIKLRDMNGTKQKYALNALELALCLHADESAMYLMSIGATCRDAYVRHRVSKLNQELRNCFKWPSKNADGLAHACYLDTRLEDLVRFWLTRNEQTRRLFLEAVCDLPLLMRALKVPVSRIAYMFERQTFQVDGILPRPPRHIEAAFDANMAVVDNNTGALVGTFLHVAIQKLDWEFVLFLLEHGADIMAPNCFKNSPVHLWLAALHKSTPTTDKIHHHMKSALPRMRAAKNIFGITPSLQYILTRVTYFAKTCTTEARHLTGRSIFAGTDKGPFLDVSPLELGFYLGGPDHRVTSCGGGGDVGGGGGNGGCTVLHDLAHVFASLDADAAHVPNIGLTIEHALLAIKAVVYASGPAVEKSLNVNQKDTHGCTALDYLTTRARDVRRIGNLQMAEKLDRCVEELRRDLGMFLTEEMNRVSSGKGRYSVKAVSTEANALEMFKSIPGVYFASEKNGTASTKLKNGFERCSDAASLLSTGEKRKGLDETRTLPKSPKKQKPENSLASAMETIVSALMPASAVSSAKKVPQKPKKTATSASESRTLRTSQSTGSLPQNWALPRTPSTNVSPFLPHKPPTATKKISIQVQPRSNIMIKQRNSAEPMVIALQPTDKPPQTWKVTEKSARDTPEPLNALESPHIDPEDEWDFASDEDELNNEITDASECMTTAQAHSELRGYLVSRKLLKFVSALHAYPPPERRQLCTFKESLDGFTILHCVAFYSDRFEALPEQGDVPRATEDATWKRVFGRDGKRSRANQRSLCSLVTRGLSDADRDAMNLCGLTPLALSILKDKLLDGNMAGQSVITQMLQRNGCRIGGVDSATGWNAIHGAVNLWIKEMTEFNARRQDVPCFFPRQTAALKECVQCFVAKGVDLNLVDRNRFTPLDLIYAHLNLPSHASDTNGGTRLDETKTLIAALRELGARRKTETATVAVKSEPVNTPPTARIRFLPLNTIKIGSQVKTRVVAQVDSAACAVTREASVGTDSEFSEIVQVMENDVENTENASKEFGSILDDALIQKHASTLVASAEQLDLLDARHCLAQLTDHERVSMMCANWKGNLPIHGFAWTSQHRIPVRVASKEQVEMCKLAGEIFISPLSIHQRNSVNGLPLTPLALSFLMDSCAGLVQGKMHHQSLISSTLREYKCNLFSTDVDTSGRNAVHGAIRFWLKAASEKQLIKASSITAAIGVFIQEGMNPNQADAEGQTPMDILVAGEYDGAAVNFAGNVKLGAERILLMKQLNAVSGRG